MLSAKPPSTFHVHTPLRLQLGAGFGMAAPETQDDITGISKALLLGEQAGNVNWDYIWWSWDKVNGVDQRFVW